MFHHRINVLGMMAVMLLSSAALAQGPCDYCDPADPCYDECMCLYDDECACGYGDDCDCGWGDPCDCGWGDPCECGWGDDCECGWGDDCDCGWGDPCECGDWCECADAECDPSCPAWDPCYDWCDDYDPCKCDWCDPDCDESHWCDCDPDADCYEACGGDPCNRLDCPGYECYECEDYCDCIDDPCDYDCNYEPCECDYGGDPCAEECGGDPYCDVDCGGDPCSQDCYDNGWGWEDPCEASSSCYDPCDDTCADYDPCNCDGDPCDPACGGDPCDPACGGDPCAPECGGDPCDSFGSCYDPCDDSCEEYDVCICNPEICNCDQDLPACAVDITGDGTVNITDILAVIDRWGAQGPPRPLPDVAPPPSGDCVVNILDLIKVIDGWGTCDTTGACCRSDGNCAMITKEECKSYGGQYTYMGDGVTCEEANCGGEPQPCPTPWVCGDGAPSEFPCSDQDECACVKSPDVGGLCIDLTDLGDCDSYESCLGQEDCPPGFACVVSCCDDPLCIPNCGSVP